MNRRRSLFFKALGDETRLEILRLLAERRSLSVNQLCDCLEEISQPTVSHHLQVLRNSEIVETRREGKMIFYFINRTVVSDMGRTFFMEMRFERHE